MRKITSKILISILSISILSSCLFHKNVYAVQTVKKTKTVGFYNNYSQNVSKQIYLPQAVNVTKVTTNNGNIVSSSYDNQILNLNLDNGSSSLLFIPNKYSKVVSSKDTKSTNSFASTLNYNEFGYTGILNKSGSSYVSSGAFEPSKTKWVRSSIEHRVKNYEFQDYLGLMDVPSTYCGNEAASAVYSSQYASTWNWSHSVSENATEDYSDAEGYKGTLSKTYDYIVDRSTECWNYPGYKKGNPRSGVRVYFRTDRTKLEGMVTKPSSDTRMYSQDYSGTVYKDGYDTVYDYTVTIEYEEDVLDLSLSQSPTYWTNRDVTITSRADSNFFRNIVLPNGQKVYSKIATYDVSTNGNYGFKIEDTLGTSLSKSINITNIDKINPSSGFNPYSSSWSNQDKTVTIIPNDSGGSGVSKWRYKTSSDNGKNYSVWSDYLTTSSSQVTFKSSGEHIISVEILDVATNIGTVSSGICYIDKEPPVIEVSNPTSTNYKIQVNDLLSGVNLNSIQYQFSNISTPTLTTGFNTISNGSTVSLLGDKNYIHVKAKDMANNLEYAVIEVFSVTAKIERVLEPHTPLFREGEKGILNIVLRGGADKVKITFPTELSQIDNNLNTEINLDSSISENIINYEFFVPIGTINKSYNVQVIGYKDGKSKQVYPNFEVSGNILEKIRTRIRG